MGVWQEIVDFTFTANTAEFTINLPETLTKDNLYKFVYTVNPNNTVNFTEWGVFPNGISRPNSTAFQILAGDGSGVAASRRADNGLGYANGRGPSQLNGQPGMFMGYIKISETGVYNEFANHDRQSGTDLMNIFVVRTVYSTTFPNGVDSLTYRIFSDTGTTGFTTGSRFQIYKLAAEKVADITVASNTTQVDISNLSIDKDSEYLLVSDVIETVFNLSINLFPNGLTTATDYHSQRIFGIGSTAGASRINNARYISGEDTDKRSLAHTHIKLSNIGAFTAQSYQIRKYGESTVDLLNMFVSSTAENITSITELNIVASGTNGIKAGSRFTLYKLYE